METQQILEVKKTKLNIGFFFLSLGMLITLITSVVSLLNLIFSTLDKRFPDVLNSTYQYGYNTYDYEGIRIALSTLIIFFPAFLILSFFWRKYSLGIMSHIDEVVKKWLIYIVLFLASLVTIIDLVTLVRYFVSGEITNRFTFKVIATLLIAIFVGTYYIFELLNKRKLFGFSIGIWAVIKSSLIVILVISYSFYLMGSPKTQRLLRLDERRISDLQNIQYQIINYWQQKEKLPEKLSELSNPLTQYSLPIDPEFEKGIAYEYIVKDSLTFDLCATFALPIPKGWREYDNNGVMPMYGKSSDVPITYPAPNPTGINDSWDHGVGRKCFERVIDKDIYPPFQKESVSR